MNEIIKPSISFALMAGLVVLLVYLLAATFIITPALGAVIIIVISILLLLLGLQLVLSFNKILKANCLEQELRVIAAHELKHPLTSFVWKLGEIESIIITQKKSPDIRDHLDTLQKSAHDMRQVINQFLTLAKIETGKLKLKKQAFSLVELTKKFNNGLQFDCSDSLPKVNADKKYIVSVLRNLINNAIRYTPHGQKILIKITQQDSFVRWQISHPGPGIPKKKQKNLFQKFYQVDEKKSDSGMGLYIAKMIIKNSGGKIGFKSEEGRGASFWFTLPIYEST